MADSLLVRVRKIDVDVEALTGKGDTLFPGLSSFGIPDALRFRGQANALR